MNNVLKIHINLSTVKIKLVSSIFLGSKSVNTSNKIYYLML